MTKTEKNFIQELIMTEMHNMIRLIERDEIEMAFVCYYKTMSIAFVNNDMYEFFKEQVDFAFHFLGINNVGQETFQLSHISFHRGMKYSGPKSLKQFKEEN